MSILFKIIFFFISIFVFGENTSISGFVREKNTGEPISYANVFLSNKSFGSATNQDGYFVISNVPFGNYEINASMIGFSVFKKNIILKSDKSIRMEIRLKNNI